MSQAIMLIVLTVVETNALTVFADTHRDELVDQPIAEITHDKGICDYHSYGKKMVKEHHKTIGCASHKTFLDENTS